jgi:hypothetical protein
VATGVLEHVDGSQWRLTIFGADGTVEDVIEGPLLLLVDVVADLSIELTGVRLREPDPHD